MARDGDEICRRGRGTGCEVTMVTFINKIREMIAEPMPAAETSAFGEIELYNGFCIAVTLETARAIERELESRPFPEWIVFRAICGSRFRIAASQFMRVSESTAESRAAARAFNRARQAEVEQEQVRNEKPAQRRWR